MKFFIGSLLFFLTGFCTQAQRVCATVDYSKTISIDPLKVTGSMSLRDTISNEIIYIPVVVHVLYNSAYQNISDAQIMSQIAVLNKDYRRTNTDAANTPAAFKEFAADTRINFCLAKVDPSGKATTGIIRKYTSEPYFQADDAMKSNAKGGDNAWNSKLYLNIWVCPLFGRILGYATPPGSPADKDGVVISFGAFGTSGTVSSPFDKGRTATHEVGHWLGLKHIWGDQDCGSDDVDDTPTQLTYNYNCPAFPRKSYCSPNDNGDMFMNYMDLTNDACMNMFTTGQKNKMRSIFSMGGYRNSFMNAFACDGTIGSEPAPGPLPELPPKSPSDTLAIPVVVAADIKIYPNPATSSINVSSTTEQTLFGKSAKIFSMTGKFLQQQVLQNSNNRINLNTLQPGLYILQIGEGSDKKVFKILKL